MKKTLTISLIVLLFASTAFCQDTLRMLNGEILEVKIEIILEDEITFTKTTGNKRYFSRLEKEEVFSYSKKGQSEVLVYQYNPEIGNIYELNEMRDYMIGERHADQYYRSLVSNILAMGFGVWAGYSISDGSHLSATTPFVFSCLTIIPGARVQKNEINERYRRNSAYRDGYKKVAKGKKFINALKFGGLGMLGSFILFEATD